MQRWNSPTTNATAVFSGNALGPIAPFAVDPAGGFLQLQSYRFDVTSFVTGNASFPFSFTTGGGQNFYAALVVIFSNSSEPVRTILINDGSEAIGTGSSTTTFGDLSAGSGTLTIVTQADNPSVGGESILFNGSTILGPGDIFNANLGPFASLFQLPVTALAGTNTAGVTTFDDLFGWHLAILAVQAAITCPPDETIISGDPDGDGRVTICHIPPGNPDNARTITVSVNAVPVHLAHGDYCGPCEEDDGLLLMTGDGEACSADLNVDVVVDASDLAILLGSWGPVPTPDPPDFDGDGDVDAADLAQLLGSWGPCPEPEGCQGDVDCPDDGDLCTLEICDLESGECLSPPVDCDDGNGCTDDSCDSGSGCVHTDEPDGTACADDGIFCNGPEECLEGSCEHMGINCPAVICGDTCNEEQQSCNSPAGTPCGDGDACTIDVCDGAGGCVIIPVGCGPTDGCCSPGCDAESDPDCPP